MRGRGRVAGQRLGVADVDQAREQVQRVLEAATSGNRVGRFQAEADDAGGTPAHQLLRQRVVAVVRQAGVVDPGHLGMLLQVLGNRQCVVADAVHAQRQRFHALQDQEGAHRAQRRAHVAQRHHARAADVGGCSQCLGIDHAVVAHVRLVQTLETRLVLGPGELAAVDDHAANAVAVATQVFGQRMYDDVGTMLEGAAQIRAGHGVVDDQRHAGGMGNGGQRRNVGDVAQWVAD